MRNSWTTSYSQAKWVLYAQNKTGAFVKFYGETKKEALNRFLTIYDKKGFKLNFEKTEQ